MSGPCNRCGNEHEQHCPPLTPVPRAHAFTINIDDQAPDGRARFDGGFQVQLRDGGVTVMETRTLTAAQAEDTALRLAAALFPRVEVTRS